jgi:hypothetical protein
MRLNALSFHFFYVSRYWLNCHSHSHKISDLPVFGDTIYSPELFSDPNKTVESDDTTVCDNIFSKYGQAHNAHLDILLQFIKNSFCRVQQWYSSFVYQQLIHGIIHLCTFYQ